MYGRLLHPFMPFITEEIWQHIPHEGKSIMTAPWPTGEETWLDKENEASMEAIMEVIKAIRNMRAEVNAAPGKKSEAILHFSDAAQQAVFTANDGYLHALAEADPVTILSLTAERPENAMTAAAGGVEIYLPLKGLIDMEKETARLSKELDGLTKEIARTEGKLANEKFVTKAPVAVVAKEREKLQDYEEKKRVVEERLRYLTTLCEDKK